MSATALDSYPTETAPELLQKSSLRVAMAGLLLVTPFVINHFVQGRYVLGMGGMCVNGIFVFNTWSITTRQYYSETLTLIGLVPLVIFCLNLMLLRQGVIGVFWCYPAVITCYFMLSEKKAWIANTALLVITLPIAGRLMKPAFTLRLVITLLMVSLFSAMFVRMINKQQRKFKHLAITDPLTGLLNRTLLQETLEQAIAQNQRMGIAMTLASLDIDHFKSINDVFGHATGDRILCEISALLNARLRQVDSVFRIGGEEFLLLLYGTNLQSGYGVAEDLRHLISTQPLLPQHPVTVSMGMATLQAQDNWMTWMQRSDDQLYRAKAQGRNCVMCTDCSLQV